MSTKTLSVVSFEGAKDPYTKYRPSGLPALYLDGGEWKDPWVEFMATCEGRLFEVNLFEETDAKCVKHLQAAGIGGYLPLELWVTMLTEYGRMEQDAFHKKYSWVPNALRKVAIGCLKLISH